MRGINIFFAIPRSLNSDNFQWNVLTILNVQTHKLVFVFFVVKAKSGPKVMISTEITITQSQLTNPFYLKQNLSLREIQAGWRGVKKLFLKILILSSRVEGSYHVITSWKGDWFPHKKWPFGLYMYSISIDKNPQTPKSYVCCNQLRAYP